MDSIRAEGQRSLDAGHEGAPEAAVGGVLDDVIGAVAQGGGGGGIARAVIDDQDQDLVDAGDGA